METPTGNSAISQTSPTQAAALSNSSAIWILQRISAGEALKPGPTLDKFSKALMVQLWQQTLDEIGEARFDEAFRLALNASVYRPDIAEIRRFAGLVTAAPLEQEAKAELTKLICLMRHHGWKLTNRGKPEKEPPVLSDIVAGTICDIGDGDKMEGFKVVWRHPALDLTRPGVELDELESFRAVAGEKIERKWVEFYTRRKAEGFKRHHEFPAVSA